MSSSPGTPNTTLHPLTIGFTGGTQPHENRQPYLAVNFCIAISGVFPGAQLMEEAAVAPAVQLRSRQESDQGFLRDLYFSTRWQEVSATDWSDEQKLAFLDSQFRLQDYHYNDPFRRQRIPDHHRRRRCHRQDVCPPQPRRMEHRRYLPAAAMVRPGHRRRAVAQSAERTPANTGCASTIYVEVFNPARRLYDRLGFMPEGEVDGVYQKTGLPRGGLNGGRRQLPPRRPR